MTTPLVNATKHEGVMVLELSNPPANTYSYDMMALDLRAAVAARFPSLQGAGNTRVSRGCRNLTVPGANVPPASSGNAGRRIPTG